ncbi:MAG: hypothetical protein ORN21_02475 [Methylophilaceae bacterium]|nr:hypothetical protein [Methylophilaceae bacterium]
MNMDKQTTRLLTPRLLIFLLPLLCSCGNRLEGVYEDHIGVSHFTFHGDGIAYISAFGIETDVKYDVDKDRLRLHTPQGNIVLRIRDNSTIEGPLGILYTKKQ